jgi:hypothetical protein
VSSLNKPKQRGRAEDDDKMGDPLSIVSGSVAVVGFAGSLGSGLLKLKKLLGEVRDAPKTISDLLDQAELMLPLLEAIEASFAAQSKPCANDAITRTCFAYCQRATRGLEVIAREVSDDLSAARVSRRIRGRGKVLLKQDRIAKFESMLSRAIEFLQLALTVQQPFAHE